MFTEENICRLITEGIVKSMKRNAPSPGRDCIPNVQEYISMARTDTTRQPMLLSIYFMASPLNNDSFSSVLPSIKNTVPIEMNSRLPKLRTRFFCVHRYCRDLHISINTCVMITLRQKLRFAWPRVTLPISRFLSLTNVTIPKLRAIERSNDGAFSSELTFSNDS